MKRVAERKPEVKNGEVFATDLGWVHKRLDGTEEVLVSCKGLKSFIDSQAEPVQKEPVVEVQEEVEVKPKRGRKPAGE